VANGSGRKKAEKLDPRRLRFAAEYLKHGNAVESARQATRKVTLWPMAMNWLVPSMSLLPKWLAPKDSMSIV
jgi:hypothetical protein